MRIILERRTIKVNSKSEDNKELELKYSLGGVGRYKPSISNLDKLRQMKYTTRFECSPALYFTAFYVAKKLVTEMKEVGFDSNPKGEAEHSILKEGSR